MTLDPFIESSKFERTTSTLTPQFRSHSLPLIIRIMRMLDDGYYPARIAGLLGKTRSHIHYYIKKLEKAAFIEKQESLKTIKKGLYVRKSRGALTLYHITQAGTNFIAGIERGALGRVVRLHNCYFKYPILRGAVKLIDWRKVELNNWTQLIGLELGLKVRKNPKSVEVIAPVVEGRNPYRLLLEAKEQADVLAGHLEQKFGMVLGRGKLSRKTHFGIYDPVANELTKYMEFSGARGKMDQSETYGELDLFSPEAAEEYLVMPAKISHLESDISDVKASMQIFGAGMREHMKLIANVEKLVVELREVVRVLSGKKELLKNTVLEKKVQSSLTDFADSH